jgi:hypothetical protein
MKLTIPSFINKFRKRRSAKLESSDEEPSEDLDRGTNLEFNFLLFTMHLSDISIINLKSACSLEYSKYLDMQIKPFKDSLSAVSLKYAYGQFDVGCAEPKNIQQYFYETEHEVGEKPHNLLIYFDGYKREKAFNSLRGTHIRFDPTSCRHQRSASDFPSIIATYSGPPPPSFELRLNIQRFFGYAEISSYAVSNLAHERCFGVVTSMGYTIHTTTARVLSATVNAGTCELHRSNCTCRNELTFVTDS